ncbi:tetratricopeptide repeat protein [Myceligenerans xiligouense]|uniref:Tetratricopeptide repeat protein n=1 Tax=Myceligenerans xiligouense TaxID=253184 RepID=A0A3N4ZR65_9MICO|nr:hypothetical protein [Myceligenerans xiligouense]RPF22261.1 hypothetical protein EDD34_2913 [Myceligenerans xiligouense]
MTPTLPAWTSPTFAEDIRRTTLREYDVDELLTMLRDMSNEHDVRFSCLYAILQALHRQDRDIDYGRLVDEYENEFGDNPYFHTFRATRLIGDRTSGANLARALRHSERAIKVLDDRAGVWHQYAAIAADLGEVEPARLTAAILERALVRVENAMSMSNRDNPNFHFTRARLLQLDGQVEEALSEVQIAIHRQRADLPGDERRLARFEGLRARLLVERQGHRLLYEIGQARRDLEGSRSDQVQLLGVLAAVIALITAAVTIATQLTVDEAIPLLIAATSSVTLAFSCLLWAGGIAKPARLIPGFVLGTLLMLGALHLTGQIDLTWWI